MSADEQYVEAKPIGVYFVNTHTGPMAVVFLQRGDEKLLPVYIGLAEAVSIDVALRNEPVERPLTHDLAVAIADAGGITFDRAVIDDGDGHTYYAKLYLNDGKVIDSRPSDCIALAVRKDFKIYVDSHIFEEKCISKKDVEVIGPIDELFHS